ncbi:MULTISPECIES: HyaD/HybD family hydrogenase maturation endopeptidase [unclassified Desulfovibrio]|uniref:HyaD/HybD family hydrogenase maturation endopeptidase n=1 Tax=unclassified Desulfovibrio TaxID=2593640 RepID=UPI0013EE3D70|nr:MULTISPECIES: HyaD/HybD family hydrogenase maturation endopeptidase [unclassified Desulfovibrio]
MPEAPRILALGLGNILCGDDGFGIHAIERLYAEYDFPENVRVMDGGTQGQTLYGPVTEADCLVVFDAADMGLEPGSLAVREADGVPLWLGARKLSPHQSGFMEVLALASLRGALPATRVLIGCQPLRVEFGESLSAGVRDAIPQAVELGVERLRALGAGMQRRGAPRHLLNDEIVNSRFMRC